MGMLQSLGIIIGVIILGYLIKQYKGKRGKPVDLFPSQELTGGLKEFQFEELLEKCKEDPGRFLEEYKNTPVFVVGTVKSVSEAKFSSKHFQKTMLFVGMKAGAEEEGKFLIAAPESQVVKGQELRVKEGQELRVKVYISEISIRYGRDMREKSISVMGYPERSEDQQHPPTSKEEEIYLVPAWYFMYSYVTYKAYKGFDPYYKTFIFVSVSLNECRDEINLLFDSYLKKSELAPIFAWEDHKDNVKIKGKKEEGSRYHHTRVRHCKILGMQKISQ